MKRKTKKILLIVLISAGCVAALFAGLYFGLVATVDATDAAWRQMEPVDLSGIPDGIYNGRAGAFICSTGLDVTVKDHRIVGVAIRSEINGGGKYRAEGMTGRIVSAQSPDVDVVSGATLTSKTIMVAVYNALVSAEK